MRTFVKFKRETKLKKSPLAPEYTRPSFEITRIIISANF